MRRWMLMLGLALLLLGRSVAFAAAPARAAAEKGAGNAGQGAGAAAAASSADAASPKVPAAPDSPDAWLDKILAKQAEAAKQAPGPHGEPVILVTEKGPVYLRSLDDPANPYRGQYTDYDRWLHDHYKVVSRDELQAFGGAQPKQYADFRAGYPQHYAVLTATTDGQGFLIPAGAYVKQWDSDYSSSTLKELCLGNWWPRKLSAEEEQARASWASFNAAGVLDPALLEQLDLQRRVLEAPGYPEIPAWLGEHPAAQTIFVPNGEFLCYGPLGLQVTGLLPRDSGQRYFDVLMISGQLWYRYSPVGKLLGKYDLGEDSFSVDWQSIYWPGYAEFRNNQKLTNQKQHPRYVATGSYGYSILADYGEEGYHSADWNFPTPKDIAACYDFDGSPVDPNLKPSPLRQHVGQPVEGKVLAQLFTAQVQLGLTSAASQSPYAGQADGPQLQLTPQPRMPIARNESQRRSPTDVDPEAGTPVEKPRDWVQVRPLDDPANPYREQYKPWDYWIYQNAGMHPPSEDPDMLAWSALSSKLNKQAADEKRELTKDEQKQLNDLLMTKTPPGWGYYDCHADANGWMLPTASGRFSGYDFDDSKVDVRQKDWYMQGRRTDLFSFNAGGFMPPDLAAAYGEASLKAELARMPQIPAWLMQQGVNEVFFMPNGDVVTYGAPGSWDMDSTKEYKERKLPTFSKTWYRYNSAGQLQGSVPVDSGPLSALYNPGMLQVYSDAKALGYDFGGSSSVLLFRDKASGDILSAYDWQGQALDISQPIHGVGGRFCQRYEWDYLLNLYQEQQKLAGGPQ